MINFPMSGMPMFMFGGPQQQDLRSMDQRCPVRVEKALEFVYMMNRKTDNKVAVTEHKAEEFPGQKPTDEERATHAVAVNMLASYFEGRLKPDRQEIEAKAQQKRQGKRGKEDLPPLAIVARCPNCQGQSMMPLAGDCRVCGNEGEVVIIRRSAYK